MEVRWVPLDEGARAILDGRLQSAPWSRSSAYAAPTAGLCVPPTPPGPLWKALTPLLTETSGPRSAPPERPAITAYTAKGEAPSAPGGFAVEGDERGEDDGDHDRDDEHRRRRGSGSEAEHVAEDDQDGAGTSAICMGVDDDGGVFRAVGGRELDPDDILDRIARDGDDDETGEGLGRCSWPPWPAPGTATDQSRTRRRGRQQCASSATASQTGQRAVAPGACRHRRPPPRFAPREAGSVTTRTNRRMTEAKIERALSCSLTGVWT